MPRASDGRLVNVRMILPVLERLAWLGRLLAVAALVSGALWTWLPPLTLDSARRAALTLAATAFLLGFAGSCARLAARSGGASVDSDDSVFAAVLLGGLAAVAVWLLGFPGEKPPSPSALRTVRAGAAVCSVLTIGIGGVGLVLAAWANRLIDYILGQLYLQSLVAATLACFAALWVGAGAALR